MMSTDGLDLSELYFNGDKAKKEENGLYSISELPKLIERRTCVVRKTGKYILKQEFCKFDVFPLILESSKMFSYQRVVPFLKNLYDWEYDAPIYHYEPVDAVFMVI